MNRRRPRRGISSHILKYIRAVKPHIFASCNNNWQIRDPRMHLYRRRIIDSKAARYRLKICFSLMTRVATATFRRSWVLLSGLCRMVLIAMRWIEAFGSGGGGGASRRRMYKARVERASRSWRGEDYLKCPGYPSREKGEEKTATGWLRSFLPHTALHLPLSWKRSTVFDLATAAAGVD